MNLIQEVFLETDWDEVAQARAARDQRAAQLQAAGLSCSCTTLYRATDGRQVFLIEAQPPEALEAERASSKSRTASRQPRPKDRTPSKPEYR